MAEVVSAEYPGCDRIRQGSISLPVGRQPGRIQFTCVGLDHAPKATGTFSVEGSESDTVTLPNCALVSVRQTKFGGSPATEVTLQDRRWEWRFGEIYGAYNQTTGRSTPKNPKTPRELAELLLDAMGETSYDVTALPSTGAPEVYWLASNPATELDALCARYGVFIGMTATDKVRLYKPNTGPALPDIDPEFSRTSSTDAGAMPSAFKVVCGPTLYDSVLKLAAVGRELSGTIKAIDALSYKPAHSWLDEWRGQFTSLDKDQQAQAEEDIFRMWQVIGVVGGSGLYSLKPIGFDGDFEVESVEQLQITGALSELDVTTEDGEAKRSAYVIGAYLSEEWDEEPEPTGLKSVIPVSVSIDPATQIVRLSRAVVSSEGGEDVVATLHLVTGVHVLTPEGTPYCYARERENTATGAGSLPLIQRQAELRVEHSIAIGVSAGAVTATAEANNEGTVADECDYYLDGLEEEHAERDTGTVAGYGIHNIGHHGNRHELTWSWGSGPPTTRIGWNSRVVQGQPPYSELQRKSVSNSKTSKPPEAQVDQIRFSIPPKVMTA